MICSIKILKIVPDWLIIPFQSSWSQGVVTYVSPVEVIVARIKIFDQQKMCWITWSSSPEALIAWFLVVQSQIAVAHRFLDLLIFAVQRPLCSLDWLLKIALNAWFSFDPSRKCFNTGHITDYPLWSFDQRYYRRKIGNAHNCVHWCHWLLIIIHLDIFKLELGYIVCCVTHCNQLDWSSYFYSLWLKGGNDCNVSLVSKKFDLVT